MSASASPRRVLVIGGTQFIGRATVRALLDRSCEVTILNRGRTPNPYAGQVRHVCCDRRDYAGMEAFLRSCPKWDAVVDFMAFEPDDLDPIVAVAPSIGLYVLISTDSVYMAADVSKLRRSDGRLLESSVASLESLDPARAEEDEYGADKLRLEMRLQASALPWLALRLPDVLGAHENTGRQQRMILRLVQGREVGGAIGGEHGAGETKALSFVFADDVAAAVAAAIDLPLSARRCCAVHVCSEETPTWSELLALFSKEASLLGIEVPPVRLRRHKDTKFVSVDIGALDLTAAKGTLGGWRPALLSQRVAETVAWWVGERKREFEASQRGGGRASQEGQRKRALDGP